MAIEVLKFTIDREAQTVTAEGDYEGETLPVVTATGEDAAALVELLTQATVIIAVDEMEQEEAAEGEAVQDRSEV